MTWKIKIHRLVIKEDLKKIDFSQKLKIVKAIKKKLSTAPKVYGKALLWEFKGYWRLRVGDYRVVYQIIEDKIIVLVVKVGIRRDSKVYEELFSRLKLL